MTGSEKQAILARVRALAAKLFSALKDEDYGAAAGLAEAIQTAGIQSLDRLMPRGTLEYPAGDRWGDALTREALAHLKHELPEAVTAQLLAVLGYWAGEAAGPLIRQLLIERARGDSSAETALTVRNGLHALHMIGGPRAVQTLQELQATDFPKQLRAQAGWFLNELGGRIEDPMFGSERGPESAEEVRRRDILEDPYCWHTAAVRLRDYLGEVGHRCLLEHPNPPVSEFPAKEATAVYSALRDSPSTASSQGELLDAVEPIVPHFMIRLAPSEVLALDPVVDFFPGSDVEGRTEIRNFKGWSMLGLLPGSASLVHLNQLPLFDPGERVEPDDSHIRKVLRDWLSVPLHLARLFGRRRHYLPAFLMIAFQDHLQGQLEFGRGISYPDLLQSVFRGASSTRP